VGRRILLKWVEEIGLEDVHGTNLDRDRDKRCDFERTVMNILVPENMWNFLIRRKTVAAQGELRCKELIG